MRVYQTQFYALDNQRLDEGLASCLLKEGIAVNSTASIDYTDACNLKVWVVLRRVPCFFG